MTTSTSVLSISLSAFNPTKDAVVSFTVEFSEVVTGVTASNFTFQSASLTGEGIREVTQDPDYPTIWYVEVNTGSSDGSASLVFSNSDNVSDADGGAVDTATPSATSVVVVVDRTAPDAPTVDSIGPTNNDSTPTVTGTAEANSSVKLYDASDNLLGSATAGGDGKWSIGITTPLSQGKNILTAHATDAGGNVSTRSSGAEVNVDSFGPTGDAAVSGTPAANAESYSYDITFSESVTGLDAADFRLMLTGTANGTVGDVTGSGSNYTVTVTGVSGTGSLRLALAPGATVTDVAGNAAALNAVTPHAVDRDAPPAPAVTLLHDTGTSDSDGVTNDGEISTGASTPGGKLEYSIDGLKYDAAAPTHSTDGAKSVWVREVDVAGNISAATKVEFFLDTTAPSAPTAELANDTGASDSDGVTSNGTLRTKASAPGGKLEYSLDGTHYGDTAPSHSKDGATSVWVREVDVAGNRSAATEVSFILDTAAPTRPEVATTGPTKDTTPTISGQADAGSTVRVFGYEHNPAVVGHKLFDSTVLAGPDGKWSFTVPAALPNDGYYSVYAEATDTAGNVSPLSIVTYLEIDTAPPAAPTVSDVKLTNDTTPELSGTAEEFATVEVYEGTTLIGETTADGAGHWTLSGTAVALGQGKHAITAVATDAAGNVSATSTAADVFVDSVAPNQPTLRTARVLTDDNRPLFAGKAEVGSTVELRADGALIGTVKADASGNWVVRRPASTLLDGEHVITATATDLAGNHSVAASLTVTVDTKTPDVPVITSTKLASVATPTLSGTAEALSTVKLYADGSLLGTVKADALGQWSLPLSSGKALAEGPHAITATATDAVGHVSSSSVVLPLVVDLTKPDAPAIGLLPAIGDQEIPVVSGTAEAGSTVEVFDGAVSLGTVVANADGEWSLTLPVGEELRDGAHSLTAVATDKAGNVSEASVALETTVDTVDPVEPVIDPLPLSKSATPTLSGTAEKGTTVEVFADGAPIGTATAGADGKWSLTPKMPLGEGERVLTAVATDAAGNHSDPSIPSLVEVDTLSPVAPTLDLTPKENFDARPVFFGTAEAFATVELFSGESLIGTVEANEDGDWFLIAPADFADGKHDVTAKATDAAGNVSAASAAVPVIINTLPPAAPTIQLDGPVNAAVASLGGTAEAGAEVEVFDGTDLLGTAKADADGKWTLALGKSLVEGEYALTARATDSDGLTSAPSSVQLLAVDLTPPKAPVIDAPTIAPNKPVDVLGGTAEKGATVEVRADGELIGTTKAGADGTWSLTPKVPLSGEHVLTAVAVDAAGNKSDLSEEVVVTVDDVVPGAPVLATPEMVVNTATPVVGGTAEAGSTVEVFDGADLLGTAKAGPDGEWRVALTDMAEGKYALTVRATDAAGNQSVAAGLGLEVDLTAPAVPTLDDLPALGNQEIAVLTGTAEAGSTVVVLDDGLSLGTAKAGADGTWSLTLDAPLVEGEHPLRVLSTDAAGNAEFSAELLVEIDLTAPGVPAIDALPALGRSPVTVVSGTAEKNATVQVFDGLALIGTIKAGADGEWKLALDAPLGEGSHGLSAVATDAAGNASIASAAVPVVVDLTAPTLPVLDATPAATKADALILSGTAEQGASVEVFDGDLRLGATAADGEGRWSFAATGLAEGAHAFAVRATDAAGNTSAEAARSVLVDFTAPVAPTFTSVGGIGNTAGRTVSGTAEAGSTVEVSDGKASLGKAVAGADGTWSLDVTLAEGGHALSAHATDAAGNASAASSELSVVVDTVAPETPTVHALPALGNDAAPVLSGTAEAGATVEVFSGEVSLGRVTANEAGAWSLVHDGGFADGEHAVTATATDAAGNLSGFSAAVRFTVDTVADAGIPATLTPATAMLHPALAKAVSYAVAGLDADARAVASFTDGVATVRAEVLADGALVVDLSTLVHGKVQASLAIADAAGNMAEAAGGAAVFVRADENPSVDDLFYLLHNPDVAAAGIDPDLHYAQFGWHEGRDPSAVFSTVGYLAANRDVAAAGVNPLEHFLQYGQKEGRAASADFDSAAYLAANADVAAAGVGALEHYLTFGMDEGRAAIAQTEQTVARGFDAEFYLATYADVAAAGVDPLQHFMRHGLGEGRLPSAELLG